MIDDENPSNQPPGQPLDYHADTVGEAGKRWAEPIGMAILAAATIFGLVLVWILSNLNLNPGGASRPPIYWKFPGALTAAAVAGWGALYYFRRPSRMVVQGMLIGFGVAILIEGICFSANYR